MDNRIRIDEAVAYKERLTGKTIKRGLLAQRIFPYSTGSSSYMRLRKYSRGESTNLDPDTVRRICEELSVDANFLFGVKPMTKLDE